MDFPDSMSIEEAFALAEAEAKLNAALAESKARFEKAEIPNRLNEDWRFGRPHKYAKELAELLQSNTPCTGSAEVQGCDEEAVIINADDDDLSQTEMLMPTIGSDALLGLHLKRFGSGYALYLEKSYDSPIIINYRSSGLYTPSTFIMAAPGVRAHIIENIHCENGATIFAARNIQVAEGAKLKVELHAFCPGVEQVQGRCMVITNVQNMGGEVRHLTNFLNLDWAREETVAEIYAEGSDTQLYSSNTPLEHMVLDQHTRQVHHVGKAVSNLLYKNVLEDKATATFAGNIYVAPGAHNTDAYQSNRNLMLSEDATVNSLPGLEILADKVRCSHGSASGPRDEEQLFYLLSRGIPEHKAHQLIALGFVEEVDNKFNAPF